MDLLASGGHSVNDGINKDICSYHYTSVKLAASQIHKLGKGTLMAKMTHIVTIGEAIYGIMRIVMYSS